MWKDLWNMKNIKPPTQSVKAISKLMFLSFAKILIESAGDEVTVATVQLGCLSIANHLKDVFE